MMSTEELTRGQRFELRCLGRYSQDREIPFINERDAFEIARRKQPQNWNPNFPTTAFGRGLLEMVKVVINRMLASSRSNRRYQLALYVAVDTPLDRHYGVDAFIELRDIDLRHSFIVTLDVSLNTMKVTGKADFIIGEQDALFIEKSGYRGIQQEPIRVAMNMGEMLWVSWYNFAKLLHEL